LLFSKSEIITGFSNREGIADRRAPRREQKARGSEMAAKLRSPRREPAMNSARTGKRVRRNSGLTADLTAD
jgi:hypothetical protein